MDRTIRRRSYFLAGMRGWYELMRFGVNPYKTMNIIDLRLQPHFIETLAQWHHQEWACLNPGGTVRKRMDMMQGYLGSEFIPSMFVCKQDDLLLGSAAILHNDMDTKMELSPWLASVFVAPDYRKRGIGRALVKHVMNQANDAGYATLYLFTPHQERFYKAMGWSTMSKEVYRGEPVTVMCHQFQG